MCDHDSKQPFSKHFSERDCASALVGSRRRKLWELPRHCHCPVIGVCMPLAALRKLVNKIVGAAALASDYEIHVGAVAECVNRNRLSEALQKDLEQRYAQVIQRLRPAKTTEALAQLWRDAITSGDVAGAFWAGLTHPRCDAALQETMCRDMHMLQHQAGAETRLDKAKFDALFKQNAVLTRELGRVQERTTRLLADKTAEINRLNAAQMQTQAQLIGEDTVIASLQAELAELQVSLPDLESRMRLKQKNELMAQRQRELEAQVSEFKLKLSLSLQRLNEANANALSAATKEAVLPQSNRNEEAIHLDKKTVLCVGGRTGSIATYRELIERVGGRFAHHDGGLEDNAGLLDASLAAADFVICQTGCIGHGAYWRVKDYCKRTGKRCVFVENPSASSLVRGLEQISTNEPLAKAGPGSATNPEK